MKDSEQEKEFSEKPNRLWLWITLLAALTVVTTLTYYLQVNETPISEDLFLAYYEPYPNDVDPLTKGSSTTAQSPYQFYELGNYDEAISGLIPNLSDKQSRWYFAQSMLAMGDIPAAQDIFEQFAREQDEAYGIHARWYLALLNIKEGKIDEGKKQLIVLRNADHSLYKKNATELLDKLND